MSYPLFIILANAVSLIGVLVYMSLHAEELSANTTQYDISKDGLLNISGMLTFAAIFAFPMILAVMVIHSVIKFEIYMAYLKLKRFTRNWTYYGFGPMLVPRVKSSPLQRLF